MLAYIDTSFILSILFEEENLSKAIRLWKKYPIKISSLITVAECYNNLLKVKRNLKNKSQKEEWFKEKKEELDDLLKSISLRKFDQSIIEIIKIHDILSESKTLDSIHLATALEFKLQTKEKIGLLTYDHKMNQLAQKLEFFILVK